jgi:hypothetical protein
VLALHRGFYNPEKLEQEGIFDRNRLLLFPIVISRDREVLPDSLRMESKKLL